MIGEGRRGLLLPLAEQHLRRSSSPQQIFYSPNKISGFSRTTACGAQFLNEETTLLVRLLCFARRRKTTDEKDIVFQEIIKTGRVLSKVVPKIIKRFIKITNLRVRFHFLQSSSEKIKSRFLRWFNWGMITFTI